MTDKTSWMNLIHQTNLSRFIRCTTVAFNSFNTSIKFVWIKFDDSATYETGLNLLSTIKNVTIFCRHLLGTPTWLLSSTSGRVKLSSSNHKFIGVWAGGGGRGARAPPPKCLRSGKNQCEIRAKHFAKKFFVSLRKLRDVRENFLICPAKFSYVCRKVFGLSVP